MNSSTATSPGGPNYIAPGPRITSFNFRLPRGESGLSVSRAVLTSPEQMLARLKTGPGSRVAVATVADIRRLGLDVIPDPLPDDPGHAEIRSATADVGDRTMAPRLRDVFRLLPETPP
jgi:hypothetical protein